MLLELTPAKAALVPGPQEGDGDGGQAVRSVRHPAQQTEGGTHAEGEVQGAARVSSVAVKGGACNRIGGNSPLQVGELL